MAERFLVTGATGQLGAYLVCELCWRGHDVIAWSGSTKEHVEGVPVRPVDLTQPDRVASAFQEAAPTHVIHAAAMAAVADCARDPARADAINHRGTATLAELAAAAGTRFVFVSTDLVFDGEMPPYRESDPPSPLSVYGRSKALAEKAALAYSRHTIVRVSLLYGSSQNGRANFFDSLVAALRSGQPVRLFHDEWRMPIGLATAASALVEIAKSNANGILHVAGRERMSRLEMGHRLAAYLKVDPSAIKSVSRTTAAGEPRPRDTSLDSSRWRNVFPSAPWPAFERALEEMGSGTVA
jgi:dTDP-4-dehydrorhamnose reductase